MQLWAIRFMGLVMPWAVLALSACSGERERPAPARERTPAPPAQGRTGDKAATVPPAGPKPTAAEPAPTLAEAKPTAAEPAPTPSASSAAGRDFIDEARVLYRVVACAGDAPVPAHLDVKVVDTHCKLLDQRKTNYRQRYGTGAREFIARLRPEGLPGIVVYPFGGGDLISALVAYPDARDVTTISLEHGGDPRRIRDLGPAELENSLRAFRLEIGGMLEVSNNTSVNLSASHLNQLPAQLSSFLVGLAVHDFEPVSVRYFTIAGDGSLRYLDDAALASLEQQQAAQLKPDWQRPNFSTAFSNVEIQFRERGAASGVPVRVHRHIAANLADAHLPEDGPLLRHLRAKGRVSAMTKAASYLLWRKDFSHIRDYLLAHMDFMLSDSTGIPPFYARQAGMVQIPLGRFQQSFLNAPERHNRDFQDLWAQRPYRRLPFRFGYVDAARQAHLLITKPSGAKSDSGPVSVPPDTTTRVQPAAGPRRAETQGITGGAGPTPR
jgi:hypothetical protein